MDVVCLRYQFELEDFDGQIFYYANHEFYKDIRTHIDYMYDCPQNLREEEMFVTPEWAKNVFVDDVQGFFAVTKEQDGNEIAFLVHAKQGDIEFQKEDGLLKELDDLNNWKNILTEENFIYKLASFEVAVLVKK